MQIYDKYCSKYFNSNQGFLQNKNTGVIFDHLAWVG